MHTVDIGEVSDDTASWWLSVLASGEGWKAAIKQSDGGEFLTPWSVTRPSEQSLAIKWRSKDSTEAQAPPLTPQSSKKAFEAPSPKTIISSLCGSFWEPVVPCNLVSPWLHPILSEVPEEEKLASSPGLCPELLAIMNGIRRPTIAAFWLRAAAGGLTPMILRRTRRGRPPLDPVAFPWNGCPQSFMDIAGTGSYLDQSKGQIWRADVWRLLHLPTTEEDDLSYNYSPRTPWEPCGKMQTTECALRVVSHLNCPRHNIRYHHWNWEVENSAAIEDEGFSTTRAYMPTTRGHFMQEPHVFPGKPLDQEASEQASIDIFRWFIFNGEGFPPGKFYKDEWLACLADDEDIDEENDEGDSDILSDHRQTGKSNGLEQWLNTLQ
ncbi:LOW QUALITY PROTEIN: similar to An01g11250 [Aspergillus luchuensis]|uniref:Similar to An01g11250 n=1 Tax=Aspergillus kawachii TaxID=1069201 RepID=A0A146F9W9_ASPKA|nr:LOW QUALITY PROTEIN: similar to An01g11250 [Aspergillus luchuensis]